MLNKKLPGFTMVELLVTMSLSSILVVFAYMGFNNTQSQLKQYSLQSRFIADYNEFNKRIDLLSQAKGIITADNEKYLFTDDSVHASISLANSFILVSKNNQADTFHLEITGVKPFYEPMNNPSWQNRLINRLEFEIVFDKQKFCLVLIKNYDAYTKFIIEKENNAWLQ